jgi:ABC-type phosphate transport system substrate-binding protein
MKRADVSRLFLRKLTTWPDGREVQAIDQERVSPARQAFSKAVHQKDADAISSYWQVLVFSGRDVPPRIGRTDAEVLEFVKANPGAVGYVSEGAALAGVKTLTVVP